MVGSGEVCWGQEWFVLVRQARQVRAWFVKARFVKAGMENARKEKDYGL